MRTKTFARAAGMAMVSLALLAPATLAQDATPMATPMASPMASPVASPMATPVPALDVPLVDAAGAAVGLATFTEGEDGVTVRVLIEGLTPGEHGWHLHEVGDCTGTGDEPFSSAGGHWNPTDMDHGAPDDASHHVGDFGNFEASADGLADATITTSDFTFEAGPTSVFDEDGTAIIIHAGRDDLTTQPSGDSGARFACGIVAEPMMDSMATPMTGAAATPMAGAATPVTGIEATPMDGSAATPMAGADATPMDGAEATPMDGAEATPMNGEATPAS